MYKAGIIGLGGIAASHFNGLKDTGRAEIVCGWDMNEEAIAKAVEERGIEAKASAERVIHSDVDIVVIDTPGFAHVEYVQQAALAGKDTICEKPVALNMKDALAIKEAVDKSGICFQVSFNHRNNPEFGTLKSVQDDGRLGRTVSAWAHLYAPVSSARWRQIQESGHWRASFELSGGRINEFCSHTVNWLLWVLGAPQTVYGRALFTTEGFELDDADYALIQCEKGVGLLDVHRHAGVAKDSNFGILGTGGSVMLKDGAIGFTAMDEDTVDVPVSTEIKPKHAEFLDCIEAGTQPLTDINSAIDTLKVCLAFNKSAKSGEVETV